ncbi:MAG: kelch repeat-containing protein [Pseudomonadota bacterium]
MTSLRRQPSVLSPSLTRRTVLASVGFGAMAGCAGVQPGGTGSRSGRLYVPRYAPALAVHNDSVYLSGGAPIGAEMREDHTYSRVLGLIERIDPLTLKQTFVANTVFARANHASVFVDGRLWLLGGRTNDAGKSRLLTETEQIDPVTQAIWRGPDLPIPLINPAAVVARQNVYVFGGVTLPEPGGPVATAAAFRSAPPYTNWERLADMPVALGSASAHVIDDRIYLIGGFDRHEAYSVTQIFDSELGRWSIGPRAPYPLSAHAGSEFLNKIYVFGDYQRQSSVLELDCATARWRALNVPFTPRRHVRAAFAGNRFIVAGGNQNSFAPALDVIEAYAVAELAS